MNFAKLLSEDRRLVILRFLAEAGGDYTLNTSVLQSALASVGHNCSRDQVETEAAWLAEQGLVEVERLGNVTVLRLTLRGADVAAGRASVPGIKRPAPR